MRERDFREGLRPSLTQLIPPLPGKERGIQGVRLIDNYT